MRGFSLKKAPCPALPVIGGEALSEEMNAFLRSRKVIQVVEHLVNDPKGSLWCFCIKYVEDYSPLNKNRERVDIGSYETLPDRGLPHSHQLKASERPNVGRIG